MQEGRERLATEVDKLGNNLGHSDFLGKLKGTVRAWRKPEVPLSSCWMSYHLGRTMRSSLVTVSISGRLKRLTGQVGALDSRQTQRRPLDTECLSRN